MPVRKISWGGGAATFDYIVSHPHIHFLFTPPAYNCNLHVNGGSTMCTKGNLPCFNRVRQRQKKNFMAHDVTFSPTHNQQKTKHRIYLGDRCTAGGTGHNVWREWACANNRTSSYVINPHSRNNHLITCAVKWAKTLSWSSETKLQMQGSMPSQKQTPLQNPRSVTNSRDLPERHTELWMSTPLIVNRTTTYHPNSHRYALKSTRIHNKSSPPCRLR